MRIAIDLNGVLRNTLGKIEQVYEKFYLSNDENESTDFKYEIKRPIDSLLITNHFTFKSDDDVYDFLFTEHPMEIFGHASSTEYTGMNDLNDFYYEFRDKHDVLIISDEIGKSKPATLFYLSKFSCMIETIKFYSQQTKDLLWDSIDVLLTANPALLLDVPNGKIVIKYNTEYNKQISSEYEINSLSELNQILKNLKSYV
jgi:hypothetical protein